MDAFRRRMRLLLRSLLLLIAAHIFSFNGHGGLMPSALASQTAPPLRVGMGAMITPKEGYRYYNELKRYLEEKMGRQILLVDRENYDEVSKLLLRGGLDIAFICSGPYVEGHDKFKLELLAMPVVQGKPLYYGYIIVPKDSKAKSLADLRNKRFAFTDPKSNTGKTVPTYMLQKMNETPSSFFKSFIFTYGHDRSIKAVANHEVDGAAVDNLIWEYMNRNTPEITARTRIIHKSRPFGISPLVVRHGLPEKDKRRLKNIFLHMHEDEQGAAILRGMLIDRFIAGDDRNYDSVRTLQKALISKDRSD